MGRRLKVDVFKDPDRKHKWIKQQRVGQPAENWKGCIGLKSIHILKCLKIMCAAQNKSVGRIWPEGCQDGVYHTKEQKTPIYRLVMCNVKWKVIVSI